MKLTVVTTEPPYPPVHGGRVDVWRRLEAFAAEDVALQLVFWYGENNPPKVSDLDAIRSVCESVVTFPIRRGWDARLKAVFKLATLSIYLTNREITTDERTRLYDLVGSFRPDAFWADAVFSCKLAIELANRFDRKLFYRSQNIEFQYRQQQYERAVGIRDKAMCWMSKSNLRSFESMVFKTADTVFDISTDDLKFWKEQDIDDIRWLPPFVDETTVAEIENSGDPPSFDLAYLGNLYTPNNIEGIKWFLQTVFPIMREDHDVTFLLSGTDPHPEIVGLSGMPGVTLLPNAKSVADVYRQGRVLINPILSGSGLNVKSAEMLFSGKTVVTTPQGVAGLPDNVRACFKIAASASEFAEMCLSAIGDGGYKGCDEQALSQFRPSAIKPVIEYIRSRISA
jgi:hypothetical protein